MSHGDRIADLDPFFEIDPLTKKITNMSSVKNTVAHNEHDSERFTFSIPRYVEAHDMSESDSIEIHYNNIDSTTRKVIPGVYEVDDVTIYSRDGGTDNYVSFTWLLSNNVTSKVGTIEFSIHFKCYDEDGEIIYAWITGTSNPIAVIKNVNNTETIYIECADIIHQWKDYTYSEVNRLAGIINDIGIEVAEINAMLETLLHGGGS